jgi:gamma-glutamylcyclotransferase (GGCT)/AIG2-like uncharacterized protein YtfP
VSSPLDRAKLTFVDALFVYGTLRPGDVRWHHLEPFVVDEGWDDAAPGQVFDTGLDYPAAVFDDRAEPGRLVIGRTYLLLSAAVDECLAHLDEVEDVVSGEYRRVVVRTRRGIDAWAYEYGSGLDLVSIESGDWFRR